LAGTGTNIYYSMKGIKMIKRLMLTLILMLCVCGIAKAADPNESVTFWLSGSDLGYQNTDISAWLGYRQDNTEIGVAADWRMFSEGDTAADVQSNFAVGPYGVFHMPGLIEIDNPFGVDWLPDKLAGDPFVGVSYLFDVDGKGTSIKPVIGVRIFGIFAVKYEYSFYNGGPAEDVGKIGLSYQHKF
jgi:hypothetical protein